MDLKVTIVIPTMNRPQSLRETICSLCDGTALPDELIVVDQSLCLETIREYQGMLREFPLCVQYIHLPHPSLTYARNEGMRQARNEIVIFMDDDVTVERETIANVRNIMSSSEIALVGGYDLCVMPSNSWLGFLFFHKSLFVRDAGHVSKGVYGRYPQRRDGRVKTQWAMGFFFVLRKSLVKQWGLSWDEKFISYGYPEDLDFSYRYCQNARENGLQCILDSSVAVFHHVSQEWRETSRAVTMMEVINREYLTYKWKLPFWRRLCTRWANFGTFLYRLVKWNRPLDVIKAQFYCDRFRADIRKGNLHTEIYIE